MGLCYSIEELMKPLDLNILSLKIDFLQLSY